MIALRFIEQLATLVAVCALLGVPGAASVVLLRLRSVLPDSLIVPAAMCFGVLPVFAATAVHLGTTSSIGVAFTVYAAITIALAGAAILVHRRRRRAGELVQPRAAGWSPLVTATLVFSMFAAWVIRGQVRFDLLYHASVSRKLADLDHSSFSNINRFADGGPNPAYALPGWHELIAMASELVHADVLVTWQVLPVLTVAASLLAAAGLARVVTRSRTGEALAAVAWCTMRILYSRREVDGDAVVFGALPGNVVFEIVFPLLFATLLLAVWNDDRAQRRRAHAVLAAATVVTMVLHANYVMYIALAGVGYLAWWMVCGPIRRDLVARTAAAAGVVALVGGGCLAILLPLLAKLENFGNAPEEPRIDYHMADRPFGEHIRGGHFYDNLGLAGLIAMLLVPVVAARWRTREAYLVSGALLAYGTFAFVSPVFDLISSTGSLTVGLRINHAVAMFLPTVLACALLLAAASVERMRNRFGGRGRVVFSAFASGAALLLLVIASHRYGYPLFGFNSPGYLSWLLLSAVLVWHGVRRLVRRDDPAGDDVPEGVSMPPRGVVGAIVVIALLGLLVPGGLKSLDRTRNYIERYGDAREAGDLQCLAGPVTEALQRVPPGSTVLSDPATSFRAMALAPVYVVGDYKVWNAATEDNRTIERLAEVNRFFDTSLTDEQRLEVTERRDVDYLLVQAGDVRWITSYGLDNANPRAQGGGRGAAQLDAFWRALDSFPDVQTYDGGRTAALIARNPDRFDLVAWDPRALVGAVPDFRDDDEERGGAGESPEPIDENVCRTYALLSVDRGPGGGS